MRHRRPLPLIVPFGLLIAAITLASADFSGRAAKTPAVSTAAAADITFAETSP